MYDDELHLGVHLLFALLIIGHRLRCLHWIGGDEITGRLLVDTRIGALVLYPPPSSVTCFLLAFRSVSLPWACNDMQRVCFTLGVLFRLYLELKAQVTRWNCE